MSDSDNIDKFNELSGLIFAKLYSAFPIPTNLSAAAFVGENNVISPDGFTGAELTKDAEFFVSSVDWLIKSGFISVLDKNHSLYWNAVLTEKGLETLKLTPDSLSSSLGARLVEASKSVGLDSLKSLASQVLSIAIKATTGLGG